MFMPQQPGATIDLLSFSSCFQTRWNQKMSNGDCSEMLKGMQIVSLDGDGDGDGEWDCDADHEEEEEEAAILGFPKALKPEHNQSLDLPLFPSKAGGVPAWLDPVNLPSGKSCLCDLCEEPLQFVLQLYAPKPDKESAYHRTLYVFMCTSMVCLRRDQREQKKSWPEKRLRSVKVFRRQLPRTNRFYSSDDEKRNGSAKSACLGAALCNWCGTWKGVKICSSCKGPRYCSPNHQAMHWRFGHKAGCRHLSLSSQLLNNIRTTSVRITQVASKTLWPEYEIRMEDESDSDSDMSDGNEYAECEIPKEHENVSDTAVSNDNGCARSLRARSRMDDPVESSSSRVEVDTNCFASFQKCISKASEQVLRYRRNGAAKPLWPYYSGRPSNADIPNCCHCDGPMDFEFQIMPQLLYYFKANDVDSLDWATVVVFTCRASCDKSVSYKEEFPWVQLHA